MKLLAIAAVAACAAMTLAIPARAGNQGFLEVRVSVNGEDRSGGRFWVVILPANTPQPITPEQARAFARPLDNHVLRRAYLPSGDYLVGLVESAAVLDMPVPEVITLTSGIAYPAVRTAIEGGQTARVMFVRRGYPPLPPGFVVPHSDDLTSGVDRSGQVPAVGSGSQPIRPPDTGSAGLRR